MYEFFQYCDSPTTQQFEEASFITISRVARKPLKHKVAKYIGARTNRYKLICYYELDEWELYDLKTDKSEMNNVYNDKVYQKVQAKMKEQLMDLMKQYKDQVPSLSTV